jgi:monodehydroascorbate reductase (NADH)
MGLCSSKSHPIESQFGDPEDLNSSVRGSKTNLGEPKGDKFQYVIVGFGVAAGYAAKKLADLGVKDFDVAIVGEEPTFAYERPALSKGYLFPPGNAEKLPTRLPKFHTCAAQGDVVMTEEWYQDRNWTCYLGTKVLSIDVKKKTLRCQGPVNEEWVRYEKLIVCTGSKPVKLTCPGAELKNIYYIRSENDTAALVRKLERETGNRFVDRKLAPLKIKSGVLQSSRKLGEDEKRELSNAAKEDEPEDEANDHAVVLGGGYLGVEMACAVVGWGFSEVHLVYREDNLYSKMPWTARFREKVQDEIVRRMPKIKLHPNCSIEKLNSRNETSVALGSAVLTDGTLIETHCLIACIGAVPCGKELFPKKSITVTSTSTLAVDGSLKLKSNDAKDIWVCGELAKAECGVEAARAMGKYVGEAAFNDYMQNTPLPAFKPESTFRYSRLFEYTSNPLVWYQIGDISTDMQSKFVGENNHPGQSGAFATFYSSKDSNVLKAAVVCGSSGDKGFLEESRKLVEKGTATIDDALALFNLKGYHL